MTGFYIGTLTQCEDYNLKVKKAKRLVGKATSNWTSVRRHPTKSLFAISVCGGIEPDEGHTLKLVEQLTEDWNEVIEDGE